VQEHAAPSHPSAWIVSNSAAAADNGGAALPALLAPINTG
jgi:hypothetical protein